MKTETSAAVVDGAAVENGTMLNRSNSNASAAESPTQPDDALQYLKSRGDLTWTAEEEHQVVRKIDHWLLPILFAINLFSQFDSQAFGIAAIFGMIQDLKLYQIKSLQPLVIDTNRYSWTASIYSFGGIFSLLPIVFLAQRVALGKVTASMAIWGGVFSLLMLAIQNFKETMIIRFLYGFQSAVLALSVIMTSSWYKQDEQPLRIGIWSSGGTFGALLGQVIDYGAVSISSGPFSNGHEWKYMYAIFGSLAIAAGLVSLALLADNPMNAAWLKPEERDIAVARLKANGTGIHNKTFKVDHVIDSLVDVQFWAFAIAAFGMSFSSAAIGAFGALIVQNLPDTTPKQALLLLMPASAIAIVCIYTSGLLAKRFPNKRMVIGACFIPPSIVGNILTWKSAADNKAQRLAGFYLATCFYGYYIQFIGLIASNVGGNTKKSFVNSAISVVAAVGAIVAPFAFKGEESARGYPSGIISLLVMDVLLLVASFVLMAYYMWQNRRRDQDMEVDPPTISEVDAAFADRTERYNPYFRYSY